MSIVLTDLAERLGTLTKLVLAAPVARIGHSRVTVRPLTLRGSKTSGNKTRRRLSRPQTRKKLKSFF